MDRQVAPALRALLERSLDFVGGQNGFDLHRASPHSWILNRIVLPHTADLAADPEWRVSVLAEEPFELHRCTAAVETRSMAQFGIRTYREIPVEQVPEIDCWKFRIGAGDAAEGMGKCARRILAFKVSDGLDPRQFFLYLAASVFAWHNRKLDFWRAILEERDPDAFGFGEELRWRDRSLASGQVRAARRDFVHAIDSPSFDAVTGDLEALGWIRSDPVEAAKNLASGIA